MWIIICPICGGKVAESRIDCMHCGHILNESIDVECEDCGEILPKGAKECPECGSRSIIDKSLKKDKIRICPICSGKVYIARSECIHCGHVFDYEEKVQELVHTPLLFTYPTCLNCKMAKQILEKANLEYEEVNAVETLIYSNNIILWKHQHY